MYIRRVVVANIKGFGEASFDFAPTGRHKGWAVVTGDNGSGKSALLRAISIALLGPEQIRGLVPDFSGWVTEGSDVGSISVEILPNHNVDKTSKGGYPTKTTFWAEVELRRASNGVTTIEPTDVFRSKRKGAVNGPWEPGTQGWCALAYGPFRRLYGSSPDAQRLMVIPGRIPQFTTLFREDATLAEGEEWLKTLHHRSLEGKDSDQTVLTDLRALLGDNFLQHGFYISEISSEGVWLQDRLGRKIALADMSEGYRSALAMVIDIFRHLSIIYGAGILRRRSQADTETESVEQRLIEGPEYYVQSTGLVMIDEVDAHLHPAWQRTIGFWLKEHFPNVQFIVTSHSPLVAQAADNGRIYRVFAPDSDREPFQLDERSYEEVVRGRADEVLLSDAFGLAHTRSPLSVNARRRFAQLAAKSNQAELTDVERKEWRQLRLFVSDPVEV
jgi:hypothetical protein